MGIDNPHNSVVAKMPANTTTTKTTSATPASKAPASNTRAPKFYGINTQKKVSRKTNTTARLRSSITPGTVLILLAGRFRGKRVVFLKQLPSGLLLVSGPFKINDAYFTKEASKRSKGSEKEFFGADGKKGGAAEKKEKKEFPADKSGDQKSVDKALLAAINKTENLAKYLGSTFSLSKGQYPHQMQF